MLNTLKITLDLPLKDIPEIKVPQKDLEDLKKQMTALVPLLQVTRSDATSQANVKTAVSALVKKIGVISKLLPTVVPPGAGQPTPVKEVSGAEQSAPQQSAPLPEAPSQNESMSENPTAPQVGGKRKLRRSKKASRKKSKKTLRRSRRT
jgi:hypothetical protein